jgi:ABC-type antimicrobial peptide transport system permease subunit
MRTNADPSSFVTAARETVLGLDRELPIYYVLSMDDVLVRTIWQRQFFGYLFTVFGGVALFLACIGIYGVMSYSVAQRTQEIGVRMALGAQPTEVINLVVRGGLRLVGYGLGAGFVAAFLLANLLAGNLYGVSPHDPPTFTAVPVLLAAVALFACWLPSRRATRIDPMAALRGE